jgi:hypothetical protein
MPLVEIRFNTKFPEGKSKYEWRLIIDGQEHFCNDIIVNCPTRTSSRFIEGEGMKYHISATANEVEFEVDDGVKYAYIR